jgi:NADH-quinone oxidoreductase subunit M
MGLPGFSGFVAELQVLIGVWQAFPTFAVVTGFGILVGVAYTLRALQKAFFGDHDAVAVAAPAGNGGGHVEIKGISIAERIGAVLLMGAALIVGIYPRLLLDFIGPSLGSVLFEGLRRGGKF